jgi:hypothetical protein
VNEPLATTVEDTHQPSARLRAWAKLLCIVALLATALLGILVSYGWLRTYIELFFAQTVVTVALLKFQRYWLSMATASILMASMLLDVWRPWQ